MKNGYIVKVIQTKNVIVFTYMEYSYNKKLTQKTITNIQ